MESGQICSDYKFSRFEHKPENQTLWTLNHAYRFDLGLISTKREGKDKLVWDDDETFVVQKNPAVMKGFEQRVIKHAKPEQTLANKKNQTLFVLDHNDTKDYIVFGRCMLDEEAVKEIKLKDNWHRMLFSVYVSDFGKFDLKPRHINKKM